MRVNKIEILKIQLRFLQKLYTLTPPVIINFTALEEKIDNLQKLSSAEQETEFNAQYNLICQDLSKKLKHFLKIFLQPTNLQTYQEEFESLVKTISAEKITAEIKIKQAPATAKNSQNKSTRKTYTPIHEEILESGLEDFENGLTVLCGNIKSNLATIATKNGIPFPASIPDALTNEILSSTDSVTLSKTGASSRKLYDLTSKHSLWKQVCAQEEIKVASSDSSQPSPEQYKKAYITYQLGKPKTWIIIQKPTNNSETDPQVFLFDPASRTESRPLEEMYIHGSKEAAFKQIRDWAINIRRPTYILETSIKYEKLLKKINTEKLSLKDILPFVIKAYSRDKKEYIITVPQTSEPQVSSSFHK